MLIVASGSIAESVNLGLILYKRLHIEGTTLRSRTLEYQADLIEKYLLERLIIYLAFYLVFPGLNRMSSQRSQEKVVKDPF